MAVDERFVSPVVKVARRIAVAPPAVTGGIRRRDDRAAKAGASKGNAVQRGTEDARVVVPPVAAEATRAAVARQREGEGNDVVRPKGTSGAGSPMEPRPAAVATAAASAHRLSGPGLTRAADIRRAGEPRGAMAREPHASLAPSAALARQGSAQGVAVTTALTASLGGSQAPRPRLSAILPAVRRRAAVAKAADGARMEMRPPHAIAKPLSDQETTPQQPARDDVRRTAAQLLREAMEDAAL